MVTAVTSFRFLYLDPAEASDWVLAASETFLPQLAAATQLFLALLAAIQARPVRLEPDVPYRSILLRDCTLAATVAAVVVGVTLLVIGALQATVFADAMRDYAREAAPSIVSYVNESREELSEPPPPATVERVASSLQPPALNDLGRSIFNLVLRTLLFGLVGALVGLLRGRFGASGGTDNPETVKPARG
ncbi:MAG: hypothetical protein M3157_01275 [Actinomycetota bacterium]|nr:hypothetical protein [Actinomycetota bacterium]